MADEVVHARCELWILILPSFLLIGSAFHFSLVRWYFDVKVYELVIFILEMLYF